MKIRSLLLSALVLGACTQAPVASEPPPPAQAPPPAESRNEAVTCAEPRPQACTAMYDPVCATRDTGIRCVTTPCPSSEQKTMGNSCSACSDPKVISYVKGECPAQ